MTMPVTGDSPPTRDIPSESALAVACLLSLSGGFLDAFTYVGHGQVFANAMTGNVVLLGVRAAAGDWRGALDHIPPIFAFLAGVFMAQAIRLPMTRLGARWPALSSLLLEILVLLGIAFLPRSFPDIWIVLSISFVAALQHSSFTRVRSWSYNSVMTTGNLRRFAEGLFTGIVPRRNLQVLEQAAVFGAICLAFMIGALIGGLTTGWLHNAALFVPVLVLSGVLRRWWQEGAPRTYPQSATGGGDIQAPS
jgi:uncharacterized membrane protein YoaK (UPF0700 family)